MKLDVRNWDNEVVGEVELSPEVFSYPARPHLVWEVVKAYLAGRRAGTHATKSGARVIINTSPEPITNWTASIVVDVLVIAGLWTALNHPWLFLAFLIGFIVLMIWLLPKLWRGIGKVFGLLKNLFRRQEASEPAQDSQQPPA